MLSEEELKQALEHDAQVPTTVRFGSVPAPAAVQSEHHAPPSNGGAALARLAREAACVAVLEVMTALKAELTEDEALDMDFLDKLVRLAERLDVLADKADASGR